MTATVSAPPPTIAQDAAASTPTKDPSAEEALPPTPEVHVNGRRASSVRGQPPGAAQGEDGWGSHFWVTLVDPQVSVPRIYVVSASNQCGRGRS